MKKEHKKIPKASKRRLFILAPICITLFVLFCMNVVTYTYKIYNLSKDEKELTQELDKLKTEKEELNTEIEKLQDSDYLARYAREKYLYSKDGEYVIKIEDTEEEISNIQNTNNKYKYATGFSVLLFVVVLIIVIKQIKRKKK